MVTEDGTPNRDIQLPMNARATVSAVMSGIGIASGHLVNLSMQVTRRYDTYFCTGIDEETEAIGAVSDVE